MGISFAGRVEVDEMTGCWNWKGCVQSNGYGRVRYDGHTHYAHRVSYEQHHGPIPEGMDVCHRCDNRKCCNPDHLFVGTRLDNMQDAQQKGRVARGGVLAEKRRGSRSPLAKLDEDLVRAIRAHKRRGVPTKLLADIYGVTTDNIRRIVRRDTWRHI